MNKPVNTSTAEKHSDKVRIVFYADPLCCWCWAFEANWKKFCVHYESIFEWEYCMGGMIPNWTHYSDPLNMVSKPAQMAPMWMQAQQISGQPIYEDIWMEDPPESSYPACLAVKTAGMQSILAGKALFSVLQESVMMRGINIAKTENISRIARQLSVRNSILNYELFVEEYNSPASLAAFRTDLQQVKLHQIGRFPTLTMTRPGRPGVMITGYRPFEVLIEAFFQMAPECQSAS
ncbi:DsbA family protein [Arundinibacter roseus]|uniref:DsbA family protein n=1 Tax=Arundinibacter roseus TaxID=2070510 RepID=A0A4R4KIX5_9BACT|nr:DsbA family protein [Arundinibacter roseus]TDB68148.1 DsbA family protein [Arundinibacter roseus]